MSNKDGVKESYKAIGGQAPTAIRADNQVVLLQSAIRAIANRDLRINSRDQHQFFKELDDYYKAESASRILPEPANNRQRLIRACYHKPDDSLIETLAKCVFFGMYVKPNIPDMFYGIPYADFHDTITIYPQIELYFRETKASAERMGRQPVHSTINVRIRQNIEQIKESDLKILAKKIRSEFLGYKLDRGIIKASYYDKAKGYQLSYFAKSESSAKDFFRKILQLQDDTFNDECLSIATRNINYKAPGYKRILGENRKMPRKRPDASIHFRHALFKANGLKRDIPLVDTTGIWGDAYESGFTPIN